MILAPSTAVKRLRPRNEIVPMSNKWVWQSGCLCGVLMASVCLFADDAAPPVRPAAKTEPSKPELRTELLRRQGLDQKSRATLAAALKQRGLVWDEAGLADPVIKPLAEEMQRTDEDNRRWLARIIDEHGWPLISQVGRDGAQAAFLIAQHVTDDLVFQQRCLSLMQKAAAGEIQLADVALLTDRVRLAEGKKQLYGSQVERTDGEWVLRPTVDPDNLDARRPKMGLPPMKTYFELLDSLYGTSPARPTTEDPPSPSP